MIWFKRDPLLAGLICATVALTVGEGWWLWRVRAEAIRALSALEQKNRERDALGAQSLAPTEENEVAVDRELISARTILSEAEMAFVRVGVGGSPVVSVTKPIDEYFEIAGFVERTRTLALQSHLSIRPDERFGFASYASEGPTVDALPVVVRQRTAMQMLMEALLAAQPTALISVQREHPPASAVRAGQGDPADFFEPVPALSLRHPGELEADAFKVEFTGQTRVLREFLNRVLSDDPSFAVRTVEAEPANASTISPGSGARTGTAVPIIAEGLSRFHVVVERLRPVVAKGNEMR